MYLQQIKCFKKNYLQQSDPLSDNFMLAVKVTIASIIAAALVELVIHQQGMFLILSTILFMITSPGASKQQQFISILLAGGLGSLGVFAATLASQHLIGLLLVTAIFVVEAAYINRRSTIYGLAGLLALLLIVITGGTPGDSLMAEQRLLNCLLGLAIGLLISFIFLPRKPIKKLQRGLLVLLSDMTDYFYHISADCLRGNHINPRHWQIKERILLTLNKNRSLVKELNASSEIAATLKKIFAAQETLLQSLLPLASIMTSPANNAAFINVLPALAQFSTATHVLMRNYKNNLWQPFALADDTMFLTAVDNLKQAIDKMIDSTLEKTIVYHWPFDITIFSYLLNDFTQAMLAFKKALAAVAP